MPRLEIEVIKEDWLGTLPQWVFVVNLNVDHQRRHALWMGTNYEEALAVAERLASSSSDLRTPMPIRAQLDLNR